ncbi:PR4B [Linum perenne]
MHLPSLATVPTNVAYFGSYHKDATFHDYGAKKNSYKLTDDMACYASNGTASSEWGQKYGWVAFCERDATPDTICGRCLRVQKEGADYTTARIVDLCPETNGAGLVLDYDTVFEPIDKSGSGKKAGHMSVEYHFVSCYQ